MAHHAPSPVKLLAVMRNDSQAMYIFKRPQVSPVLYGQVWHLQLFFVFLAYAVNTAPQPESALAL
jgi:hypothetical protein